MPAEPTIGGVIFGRYSERIDELLSAEDLTPEQVRELRQAVAHGGVRDVLNGLELQMEGDSQRLEFPPDITARTLGLPEGTDMGSYMFFLSEASHSERHYPNDPTARVMVKAWEVLQRHLGERLGPTPPDGFGGVFTDEAYRSGFYHVVGMLAERVFPGYKLAPKSPVGKIVLLRK